MYGRNTVVAVSSRSGFRRVVCLASNGWLEHGQNIHKTRNTGFHQAQDVEYTRNWPHVLFAGTVLAATKERLKSVFAAAGLVLNTSKNVALTTEVPPPSAVGCYNAPVFRSNGFFNTLFRVRAPASTQKTFREL